MSLKSMAIAGLMALLVWATPHVAYAETELQTAIKAGATQLTSEEIAALIVGNTVKAKSGEKVFHFYYSEDNVLSGKLDGGGWSGAGYYGITDNDRVCLSMAYDRTARDLVGRFHANFTTFDPYVTDAVKAAAPATA